MKQTFSDDDLTYVCGLLLQLAMVGGFRFFYDIAVSIKQYGRTKEKIYMLYEASKEVLVELKEIIEKKVGTQVRGISRDLYCQPARLLVDWLENTLPLLVMPFQDKSLTGSAVPFHENIGNFVKILGSFPCDKVTRAVMYGALQHKYWQMHATRFLADFLRHHTKMNDLIIEIHNSVASRHRSIHGASLTSEKLCKVGPSIMMNRLVKNGQWFQKQEWKPGDEVHAPNGASEEDDTEHGEIFDIEAKPKLEASKAQKEMVKAFLKTLVTRLATQITAPVPEPAFAQTVPSENRKIFENDLHSRQRRLFGAKRIKEHIIPATMKHLEEHKAKHDRREAALDKPAFEEHLNKKYTANFLSALLLNIGEQIDSKALKPALVQHCLDVFESPVAFQKAKRKMGLTSITANQRLAEEKKKRAAQRAAQATTSYARYARYDDGDDDAPKRASESDDDEMDVDVVEEAAQVSKFGRRRKKRVRDDAATHEELQREIDDDKQSRKKHKVNSAIRERQMRILQSSNGLKSLCEDCGEHYPEKESCNCHPL